MASNTAPMGLDLVGTDDEDLEFTLEWTLDGSAFPWSSYTYAYAVSQDGCEVFSLSGSDGTNGITVDGIVGTITFRKAAGWASCPGTYTHGCLLTNTTSGKKIQAFVGSIMIAEGGF
jgi:hypothetical protein